MIRFLKYTHKKEIYEKFEEFLFKLVWRETLLKKKKKSLSLSLQMNRLLKSTAHLKNKWHSANIWHTSNVSKDSKVIFCHNSKLYGAVYFISYKFKFRYQHLYHMIIDCKAKYGHVRNWYISSYPTKKNLPSFT